MADTRLPIWLMKSHAEGSSGPRVSIATGWKTCVVAKAGHFSALRFAAWTDAGTTDAACGEMYDAEHVWTTVASHAIYFPDDQGTRVTPSGLLPSVLNRPAGSRVLGTPALRRARHLMSFFAWWRNDRPWALLHTNPCWPSCPTQLPHTQLCGAHRACPSLRPTATRIASLSRTSPQPASGRAIVQSAE